VRRLKRRCNGSWLIMTMLAPLLSSSFVKARPSIGVCTKRASENPRHPSVA
jgi:hypothetical protein